MFKIGNNVKIISGVYAGFTGIILKIGPEIAYIQNNEWTHGVFISRLIPISKNLKHHPLTTIFK